MVLKYYLGVQYSKDLEMIKDNHIVVDLKKVQWAKLVWENQWGYKLARDPKGMPSVRGQVVYADKYAAIHPEYPCETELERATRLGILDTWIKVCYLKLQANSMLVYTGDKAQSVYDAFCAQVFSKRNKKKG